MAQITNQATLSYNGIVVSSNVATGEIVEVLEATKTAVPATYGPGDTVVYIVSLVNSGATPVTGVTVTDDLGGYEFDTSTLYPLTYVDGSAILLENGVLQSAPTVTPGPPMVISGLTVPAEGSVTIVYATKVTSFAPLGTGGAIENTATVDGTGISAFTASGTATASGEPDLTITKSISPSIVKESGSLTYTFLIQNYGAGAATAADNVKVTDTLDPVLTSLSASLDGAPLTLATDYTYSETTGVFETVEGVITIPAATFSQDAESGAWVTAPGEVTLTITGSVA